MAGRRPRRTGNRAKAVLYRLLLELRITVLRADREPARRRMFSSRYMLNVSIFAAVPFAEVPMPILQAFGPSVGRPPLPAPAGDPTTPARRYGVLPMPSLEWNAQVEREAAPLYARVKTVIPAIEWPFFAPYVKAI